MILLDENIVEDQCRLLRGRRIRLRQFGQGIGKQGMKDEEQILPLLHHLNRPTFFTRDLGFYDSRWCHDGYSLVCLAVGQNEVARFISRFLRHPTFNTKAKRMGTVVHAGGAVLRVWRLHGSAEERISWRDSKRK